MDGCQIVCIDQRFRSRWASGLRRKNLSNDGVSYPVGIFLVNYAAQYATAEMVSILLQERAGGLGCQNDVARKPPE